MTTMDSFYINKFKNIVDLEKTLQTTTLTPSLLLQAKRYGFTDASISKLTKIDVEKIYKMRLDNNIIANFKMVDTCACEFAASSAYYYSAYFSGNEVNTKKKHSKKILIIGSGPIRIGQGIEFDYCSVHCV
jgi:carbamoyl-phosphate synthase large subunit